MKKPVSAAPAVFRVALEVTDSAATGRSYADLLGVEARAVGGGRVYFDCGPVILALVDVSGERRKPKPVAQDVYFAVEDVKSVHARAKRLGWLADGDVHGESGGAIVTRPWGEKSFYAVDPFGNRLCFVDRKTLFTGRRP
jgi:catechol 2,3-dioxygenase-like lactoylglutathione lyase family enzyme